MLKKIKKFFKKKDFEYVGLFKNYSDAQTYLLKQTNSPGQYFDPRSSTKFCSPKDVEAVERFLAPCLIIPLIKKKKINVLDIGGGNNPIFSYIKKSTNISVYCTVVETKKLCELLIKKIPKKISHYVNYNDSLNKIKKKFDIVYLNSSIQYFENYEKIIEMFNFFNAKYVFINRTFFSKRQSDFVSIQYSVPGSIHPIIFFSEEKFLNIFKKNKYKLIFQNKYGQGLFKHNKIDSKSYYLKDLVFERKN